MSRCPDDPPPAARSWCVACAARGARDGGEPAWRRCRRWPGVVGRSRIRRVPPPATRPGRPSCTCDAAAVDSVGHRTIVGAEPRNDGARANPAYRAVDSGTARAVRTPPGSEALTALRVRFAASTAFDFFLEMALQEEVIYSTSEADLQGRLHGAPPQSRASTRSSTWRTRGPGSDGSACASRSSRDEKREIEIGGEKMKAWTEETRDRRRRAAGRQHRHEDALARPRARRLRALLRGQHRDPRRSSRRAAARSGS